MSKQDWLPQLQLYRRDPWEFMTKCVYTQDAVDETTPIKAFPAHRVDLKLYTRIWQRERFMAVPKSRRMFMSWTNISLYTWDAMWHIGKHNAFVSKKEDDADELVKRSKFILDQMKIKQVLPEALIPRYEYTFNKLRFPELNSMIQGFPQGADQLRQFTLSGILGDECAFWEQAQKFYSSSRPTTEGGGRITLISSPAPGFFKSIVYDTLDQLGSRSQVAQGAQP